MTPEQFFDEIETRKQAAESAMAEQAAAETAEQQAAEIAIKTVASQFIPEFLVKLLSFDWGGYEGYEQCAKLHHEQIRGIRIWFQKKGEKWTPGHVFVPADQVHKYPFQILQIKNGQPTWMDQFSEEFADIWIIATSEKAKKTSEPSMPVYPDQLLLQAAEATDNVSNSYRIEFTPEQAVAFLETADPQSQCWNSHLANFARAINEAVPRIQFGNQNPNDGQFHHRFLIGREYTRVIYLDIAKAYLRDVVKDMNGFISELKKIGRDYHAYEVEVERNDDGAILIRYWWDRCDICE